MKDGQVCVAKDAAKSPKHCLHLRLDQLLPVWIVWTILLLLGSQKRFAPPSGYSSSALGHKLHILTIEKVPPSPACFPSQMMEVFQNR